MERNRFTGSFPDFSGASALRYAYLGANQFDPINPSAIFALPDLRELGLSQLSLYPGADFEQLVTLANATSLKYLFANKMSIEGSFPSFCAGMPSLAGLDLSNNLLAGDIPNTLDCLVSLETLGIEGNRNITGFSATLSNPSLRTLRASNCSLTSVPVGAMQSLSLTYLDLSLNQYVSGHPGSSDSRA